MRRTPATPTSLHNKLLGGVAHVPESANIPKSLKDSPEEVPPTEGRLSSDAEGSGPRGQNPRNSEDSRSDSSNEERNQRKEPNFNEFLRDSADPCWLRPDTDPNVVPEQEASPRTNESRDARNQVLVESQGDAGSKPTTRMAQFEGVVGQMMGLLDRFDQQCEQLLASLRRDLKDFKRDFQQLKEKAKAINGHSEQEQESGDRVE